MRRADRPKLPRFVGSNRGPATTDSSSSRPCQPEPGIWSCTESSNLSPFASRPTRDILYRTSEDGRNGAEIWAFAAICPNHRAGRPAHSGRFSASLRTLSLTQPNHGRFGTDVRTAQSQGVRGSLTGRGFERAALRRSERRSKQLVRLSRPTLEAEGSKGICCARWPPRCRVATYGRAPVPPGSRQG
jgi:hypothetical protein